MKVRFHIVIRPDLSGYGPVKPVYTPVATIPKSGEGHKVASARGL